MIAKIAKKDWDKFNKPFYWVHEFILNNYMISSSAKTNKKVMYRRYTEYAIQHKKGKLTLEQFHQEIMKQRNVECITHDGKEYYTTFLYEPISPDSDEFWRVGVQPDGSLQL